VLIAQSDSNFLSFSVFFATGYLLPFFCEALIMKDSYQFYVFLGLLSFLLVISLSGCEKKEDAVESQQSIADMSANQSSMDEAQKAFDSELAKRVELAIASEEALSEFVIAVLVANSVVQLSGEVETRAEHDLVMKTVREVDGVNQISDLLRIKQ
jgi:hyperosmotically inducible protein